MVVWMVQGDGHSSLQTWVWNVRQSWHPALAGNRHFSETWKQVYIQWGRTYKSQTGRAESGPSLSCKTLWCPWSWRCGWSNSSSMQASDGEQFSVRSVLRKCFMPMICGLRFWIQRSGNCVILKYDAKYILIIRIKESNEGCIHSPKLFPDGLLRSF